MEFINLTKNDVNIFNQKNELVLVVKPSGYEARIGTRQERVNVIEGVPIFKTRTNDSPGLYDENGLGCPLPLLEGGKLYIVSGLFKSRVDREDLLQPGKLIRNEAGVVVGCIGLSQ